MGVAYSFRDLVIIMAGNMAAGRSGATEVAASKERLGIATNGEKKKNEESIILLIKSR